MQKKIAQIISKATGVTFKQKGFLWMADVKNKTIYYPENTKLEEKDLGYFIHEGAHIRYSNFDDKFFTDLEKISNLDKQKLVEFFNVIEDIRIEKKICEIYPGAKKYFDDNNIENIIKLKENGIENKSEREIFCTSLIKQSLLSKKQIITNSIRIVKKYATEEALKKSLEHCSNITKDNKYFSVVEKVLTEYLKLEQQDEEQKEKQSEKRSKEQSEERSKEQMKEQKEQIKQIIKSALKRKKENKTIRRNKILEREKLEYDLNKIEMQQYRLDTNRLIEDKNKYYPIVRKAISILKDKSYNRFNGNYTSGKLNKRNLYKFHNKNTRLFQKKEIDSTNKDFLFTLLIDASGSMLQTTIYKTKIYKAMVGAYLLGTAIKEIDRPFSIYSFNKTFKIVKDFNKTFKLNNVIELLKNTTNKKLYKETNGGYGVYRTIKELKKVDARKKIVIILSDGEMSRFSEYSSPEGKEYSYYNMWDEVKKLEKIADVYGIGIQDRNIVRYCKKNIIIDDIEELPKKLIKIFKKYGVNRSH